MPNITDTELENRVKALLNSLDWNAPDTTTKQVAKDFYVIVRTMVENILANQLSGGGKGPGPLPHKPPPPWPDGDALVSRQEDYLNKISGLLLNIANSP